MDEVAASVQDTQVLNFGERETTFVDGRCVVPIPRRERAPNFPVNKVTAVCKSGSDDVEVEAEVSARVSAVDGEVPGAPNFHVNKVMAVGKADSDDVEVKAEVSAREAQNDVYCEEIAALSCGKQVKS